MSIKAALPTGVLPRLPVQVNVRSFKSASLRTSIIMHAKIEEINTDDTPGVSTLLDRDFKYVIFFARVRIQFNYSKNKMLKPRKLLAFPNYHAPFLCRVVELNEDAFAEGTSAAAIEEEIKEEEEELQSAAAASTRSPPSRTPTGDGPKRSKDAINAGLELFAQENYAGAVEMFQLALELPGSGFMRMAGSPKEYACASEGEEQAALYNMACAYCRMNQASAALTCLEALLENGFDDFDALKTDADLAAARQGSEFAKLIGRYDGVLAKLFGKKKNEPTGEKPWIQW
jgi:tetratricopeptide (TPR) repeat protein